MEVSEGLRFCKSPRHFFLCFVLLQTFLCASVSSVLDFGYEHLTEAEGKFHFPSSSLNGTYVWNITVANGYSVQMGFEKLYLNCYQYPYYACTCYLLQIYDGAEYNSDNLLFSSACNNWYYSYWDPWPGLTTSFSNNMLIILTGYSSDLHIGDFSGFYASIPTGGVLRDCGRQIRGTDGVINFSSFPNNYTNQLVCDWLIDVDPSYRVLVDLQEYDIERSVGCKYDSLQIRDGRNASSLLYDYYCGASNRTFRAATSLGSRLLLRFVSNWNVTGYGFKANWSTVCGQIYTEASGIVNSPSYPLSYRGTIRCEYFIVLKEDYIARLTFSDVRLGDDCESSYIEVRDGGHESSSLLGPRYCGNTLPPKLTSTRNRMFIKFVTNSSSAFSAMYREELPMFTYVHLTGAGGNIRFVRTGSIGHHVWNISVVKGHAVLLTFESIMAYCFTHCSCSKIEIYDYVNEDSDDLLYVSTCQSWDYIGPGLVTSFTNNVILVLTGDNTSDTYTNIRGSYTSVNVTEVIRNCGGHVNATEGTIISPGFPNKYQNLMVCEWLITADPAYRIVLNYLETDVENSTNCMFDSLQIHDGNRSTSPLRTFVCGSNYWNDRFLTSSKSHLLIKFVSDWSVTRRGFKVNWTVEETTTPTTSTPLITTTVTTPKFTTPAATPSPDCNATGGARKLFNLQQLNFDLNSSSTNRLVIDSRLDPSSTGNNPSVKLALYPPDSFLQIQTTDNKTFSVYTTSVMPTVTKNYHFFLEAEVVSGNEIARDFAHLTVNFKRLFPTSPPVRVSFVLDGMRKGGIIYDLSTVLGNVEGLGLTLSSNPNTNLYVFSPNQTSIVCNRDVRLSEFRSNADSIAHQHVLTISTSQGTVLTLHAVIVLNRYSKQIPEDSPIGTLVADFVSLSNDFSVSVVPSAETFVLKSTNVTLGQTLDYENADQRQFKFNVSLALKSDPLLKTEIEANVIVTDVNDAPPEFQKAAYTFITWKGALANSTIGYVEVSDPDSLNGFTYQIDGTENSKYFDILPANGIIVSKVDLKNLSSLVMFNVSVKDGRNWSLRSTKVSISIIQSQNDNLTEIGNSTVVSVQEQMPMHSFVTNASMTNFIGYQLLPDFSAYVAINSSTGIITTTAVLDREDPRMPQIVFSVLAYHKDNLCNFQAISKITIEIIDINDNSPVFTMDGNYSTTLPENSKSGTTVFKVMASDKDKGENAAILFSLESGQSSAPFSIDNQTGVITVYNSSLLDREKNDTIRVVVIAVDGGTTLPSINRKSATATLTINITDMNDNSPAFPQTPYTFNISENLTAPVIVGNVAATDKDIGLNGEIWYLYQGPDSFAINRTSGLIQTTRPLDRELIRNYTLTVYAYDNGSPRLEGSCTVTIIVNDVNDNAPKFKQPYYTANISEAYNCMLSAITNVSADDPDDGLNGQVLYTITNGSLSINNSTGVIMCKASLDYENPSERDIIAQVTATDRGNPPLNASVTVRIRLTDVNDNSPEFIGLTPYNVTLPKQTFEIANATIYAVSARDRDSNENGIVFYTLTSRDPGVADLIWVDTSGVVRVNKTQSFNQGNSYIFDLVASDRGHPPKTNTTFLTLNVVILATSIRFNKSDIIIQIEEGKDPNITTPVVKLDIFDAVPPATFTLANNTVLNVNASSGYLYCISKLDREQQAIYEILATVADERSRSYAMVFVIVSDVNDNAPKFDFSESQMVTDIEENSAIGTFIIAIPAKDPDAGNNSLLTYFLLDPKIPFAVGVSDGRLVVNGTLDRETNQTYKFVLVVKDNGSPSLSSSATVTVGITDVNDNAPTFNTPEILPIPEDADYLTWSAVVKATDPDYGLNGLVKYTVKNMEACPFSVNDGVLKLERNKKLDFETNRSHTCIIQASDSPETGALSTNITVIINVTDVNDNSPIFHDVIGRLNMSRDVEIQYVIVANLNATDADSGINAEIWFDIDASTFAFDLKSYFDINAVSGNITVRKPLLDFPLESVNLTIVAHDRGEPVLSSKVQIEVIISDENTPPKFRQNMYRINITEEDFTVFLDPLITVRADDSENQTLVDTCNCTYVILGASTETRRDVSDYFSIDSSTGTISLTRRNYLIDRENTGNYINVILKVTDKGMPPKSDFATLNVTVWDVNDNAPLFNPDIVGVTITKSKCKSGQVIYQARALDADIYPNNIIGYSLIPFQSPPFTGININETTGELLLTNPNCSNDTIDGTQFWVLISASDNTYNSTLRIYITVNLSDSNPNGPVFLQPLYHASVSSADVEGTTLSIDNFRANDADGDGVTYAFEKHNLTCADDVFWINSVTGKISLQSKLDQFSLKAINLTITAADYGNFSSRFSKTGTTTVFVTVRDYTDKVCIATDKADELQSRADQFNVFRGLFIAIVLLWAITIVVSVALFYKWRVVRYNLRAKQSDTHTFDFPPLHNDADKGSKGKADTTGLPPELPRREGSHGTSSGDSGFRNPAFTIDQDKDGYLAPSEHGTSTGQFSSADSILSNLSLGSSRDTYAGGAAYMPLLPEGPSSFSQPTYLTPSSVIRGKADDPKGTYLHAVPEERGPDTPTYLHATVKPDDIQATFP